MRRSSLVVAATAVAVTAGLAAPASAQFVYVVGSDKCNVTTTGPTFTIDTLPNPRVTPDGALGASVYCPV
jgi:hypothetical protein